jgi:phosphoglycolate phosphatase-like HAD superfamily hydrolase
MSETLRQYFLSGAGKAALLDLDGTLIKNEHDYFYGHLVDIYIRLGVQPPTREFFDTVIRKNLLFSDIPELEREAFSRSFWSLFDSVKWPDADPIIGAQEVLESLLIKGMEVAIITARTQLPEDVEHQLQKTNLLKYIKVISTLGESHLRQSSGQALKKDQILYVCKRLQVLPAHALVAGDSPSDILSGKAASVSCTVGLLSGGLDEDVLRLSAPDILLPQIADLQQYL